MSYILEKSLDEAIMVMKLENEHIAAFHKHNFLELVYIISGTATHKIEGKEETLSKGDYFVVDYNTSHGYISKEHNLSIINCLFLPQFIDKDSENEQSFNRLAEKYFLKITGRRIGGPASNQIFKASEKTERLFFGMLKEYNEKKEGYLEVLRFNLSEIIIETIRSLGSSKSLSAPIEEILEIVDKRYFERLSLGEIANELHYSLPYLSALFKSETGISFSDHLKKQRVEAAKGLLLSTNLSVSEISEAVGYGSLKFFEKVFKTLTGVTPRAFRKR
jgi:AraC-like DNA-binding protein/quercetin dioxygenase-like cupin family protein